MDFVLSAVFSIKLFIVIFIIWTVATYKCVVTRHTQLLPFQPCANEDWLQNGSNTFFCFSRPMVVHQERRTHCIQKKLVFIYSIANDYKPWGSIKTKISSLCIAAKASCSIYFPSACPTSFSASHFSSKSQPKHILHHCRCTRNVFLQHLTFYFKQSGPRRGRTKIYPLKDQHQEPSCV